MQLAFEQVSYTYDAQLARKARSSASTSGMPDNAQSTEALPLADWGKNPRNPWALHDISFTVREGDFLGIAGHTGSGKSTLLLHMNGLLEPTCGQVTFDDASLTGKKTRKACRAAIGMVFQYPERQLFAPTVFDDVAFGPRNLKLDEQEVLQRVCASLQSVGLDNEKIGTLSPFELSGGQQRRVAFAGVLAMHPQMLVLDEPTAGLDPASKTAFLRLIENMHAQGMTIVMVSHNMDDLARLCTRLLVLNQGKLVLEGTPEYVFSHEAALHTMGLGIPAAQHVANKLRSQGVPLPRRLFVDAHDLAKACAALYSPTLSAAQTPRLPQAKKDAIGKEIGGIAR